MKPSAVSWPSECHRVSKLKSSFCPSTVVPSNWIPNGFTKNSYARRWSCAQLVVALRENAVRDDRLRAFRFDQHGGTQNVPIEVIVR